ncbi:MAG: general secretion pathway protein GspK [Verrucomicrobia bacterium]|nr:general secretion pathway protein GspK [Verrucomicrobiota bacterium]
MIVAPATPVPAVPRGAHLRGRSGSVLVGVLWCVVLLSVLVLGMLQTTRKDLMIGKYHADRIQAHYLALAGVEKAKALLHQDALTRSRSGVHHGPGLYNAPEQFQDMKLGRGAFSVFRPARAGEGGGMIFGVSDEEGRLNINVADVNQLTNLLGLTTDIAAAIVDWHDSDNTVSPGGAETPYYATLQPPYRARNGPIPTLRELLMVRGVTEEKLFGPAGEASEGDGGSGVAEVAPETGWAGWLTAHSGVANVDASGGDRVNVQNADVAALTGVRGVTQEIARAIVAHRGQSPIRSLVDLLDVPAAPPPGAQPGNNRNNNNANRPKVIDERLLKEVADSLTVAEGASLEGVVNVNTAPVEVLMCLPRVDRMLAQAVVAHRQANGFFAHEAALLDVPGMTREILRELSPRIAMRSETFRIRSEGRVGDRGSRQRIEVVVRVGARTVSTLAYREDDL